MRSLRSLALRSLCALPLAFAGCVATTTDIDRLQDSLDGMRRSQADLAIKMDQLDRSLSTLTEKLDDSQKGVSKLTQKLDDSQTRLGGRMESISQLLSAATTQASVPVPGEMYRSAYGDYLAGKLDLAIAGFKTFLDRFPESDLADDAQFYIADSYLSKRDYVRAREEFDKVLGVSQSYRPQALLKRAAALEGSRQIEDQKLTLKTLIKEFPNSSEGQTADQILKDIAKEEKEAESRKAPKQVPPPAKKTKSIESKSTEN